MKEISTEALHDLYEKHKSSYKVAAILGCCSKTVLERLKKAGIERRPSGGMRGGLKYPEDKQKAALRLGFCSWDVAVAMLSASGLSPMAIAKQLGETTGVNVRHRLRYHEEIRRKECSL